MGFHWHHLIHHVPVKNPIRRVQLSHTGYVNIVSRWVKTSLLPNINFTIKTKKLYFFLFICWLTLITNVRGLFIISRPTLDYVLFFSLFRSIPFIWSYDQIFQWQIIWSKQQLELKDVATVFILNYVHLWKESVPISLNWRMLTVKC